jgi:hypothetical protein
MPHESPPVFINYRNNNADNWAAALLDKGLCAYFGEDAIFWASRSIPAGATFPTTIQRAVEHARAMLIVMGDNWAPSLKAGKHPWVVTEIQTAQARNIRTIPVFLGNTERPNVEDLHPALDVRLADLVGIRYGSRTHRGDTKHIARVLGRLIPELGSQDMV